MILHIADKDKSSWSLRGWLLLKLSGQPFAEVVHSFLPDREQQWREWRAFSPTAQVPVLEDGQVRVWDSLGIALYLGERCPHIWPRDVAARAWSYAAVAEMHAGFAALRGQCPFRLSSAPAPAVPDAAMQADLARLDELWTQGLQSFGGPWLAGRGWTAADAFYAPVVLRLLHYGLLAQLGPVAQDYAARMANEPWLREWAGDGC